jgi:hypothetical protein
MHLPLSAFRILATAHELSLTTLVGWAHMPMPNVARPATGAPLPATLAPATAPATTGQAKASENRTIGNVSSPAFLYRKNNSHFIESKFSVRGRDMGSTIAEVQALVKKNVALPKVYSAQ